MAVDIKEALTRKIGPLPAWGWGVALGGGILAFRFIRGGSPSGQQAAASGAPTFVNPAPTELGQQESGFLSGLSGMLDALPDQVATAVVNAQRDTITPQGGSGPTSGYLPASTGTPTGTGISSPTPALAGSVQANVYRLKPGSGETLDDIAGQLGLNADELWRLNWWLPTYQGRNDPVVGDAITLWA